MQLKKAGGKVYGANFTAAEKKAMRLEIQRELIEFNKKNEREILALLLLRLHELFGFGEKRLAQVYKGLSQPFEDLCGRYEMETEDERVWFYTYQLKELGVDLEALDKEMGL